MKDETKPKAKETIEAEVVALRLIAKMVSYERQIDDKTEPSEAEKRHVAFLRAMREAGFLPTMN